METIITGEIPPITTRRNEPVFRERLNGDLEHEVQTAQVHNFYLQSGQRVDHASVSYCVFGTHEEGKPVVVVHPALTGSAKAVINLKKNIKDQGDGWWSDLIGGGKPFDTEKYTFICFDHFGGHYGVSNARFLQTRGLGGLATLCDGVRLQAQFLEQSGITHIHAVTGGSMGGGQAVEWLFQDRVSVGRIIDVSGCTVVDNRGREFFNIPADLLNRSKLPENKRDLPLRFLNHVNDLLAAECAPLTHSILKLSRELDAILQDYSEDKALAWSRKFGFLRFVAPKFFEDKFERRKAESNGDVNGAGKALDSMGAWLDQKGDDFVKRFSAPGLQNLCRMIGESPERQAFEIASRINAVNTHLVNYCVNGDTLFSPEIQSDFYKEISRYDTGKRIKTVRVNDYVNGHDHFLSSQFPTYAGALLEM